MWFLKTHRTCHGKGLSSLSDATLLVTPKGRLLSQNTIYPTAHRLSRGKALASAPIKKFSDAARRAGWMILSLHKRSSSRCARGTCGRKGSGGAREGEERDGSSLVRPSLCTFSSELRSDVNYPLSNHRSPGTLDGGRGRRVRTERPRPAAPRREPRSGAGRARGSDETLERGSRAEREMGGDSDGIIIYILWVEDPIQRL